MSWIEAARGAHRYRFPGCARLFGDELLYEGYRIIAIVPAFNEELKIGRVVQRCDRELVDTVLVVDDGSTDETARVAASQGAEVLSLERVGGVGKALREGFRYAREHDFDIVVILAGNDKDDPAEIPALLAPLAHDDVDFVIGSRYLAGGAYGGDMPRYRKLATRLHPWLMSWFVGKRLTETTNGFRAFWLSLLDDDRIDLDQPWLDQYGLEVYLLFKVIKLGYQHREVPCTKIYPSRTIGQTKMRPIVGWWSILKPIYLLGCGIKA